MNPDPNVSPNEAPRIDVGALREFKLLTSPKGHLSRELLTSQETFEGEFDIELETGDTEARIALGRESERVPIVPSDAPIHFEERWLVVVSENPNEGMGILGGEHSVYWRDDIENPDVRTLLTMFLDDVDRAAEPIRGRPGGAIPKSGL